MNISGNSGSEDLVHGSLEPQTERKITLFFTLKCLGFLVAASATSNLMCVQCEVRIETSKSDLGLKQNNIAKMWGIIIYIVDTKENHYIYIYILNLFFV